jgi:hypothetical protein
MKIKCLLILLLILAATFTEAEIINGPANFRDKPNGKILVSLNNGVEVECGVLKNGWYEVSFSAMITNEQYAVRYSPKKDTRLYNDDHKFIGVTTADIPDDVSNLSATGGTEGHYKWCWIEITGYVYKTNVRQNSIPENVLDSAFKSGKFSFQLDSLKAFMKKEGYWAQGLIKKTLPHYEEYCIYESTVEAGPSPHYRIGLIFKNKTLIAIEYSRPLNIGVYKEYTTSDRNRLIIFETPKGLTIKRFVDKINESRKGAD